MAIGLPGQFNRANAAMVAVAAPDWSGPCSSPGNGGRPPWNVWPCSMRWRGGFRRSTGGDKSSGCCWPRTRPGWTAIFDLLDESSHPTAPVVLSINARIADGLDTSWLWDVPFERLAGRTVVATGERCRDLAVRLRYAGVDHHVVPDPFEAVDTAVRAAAPSRCVRSAAVEFLGNYTAFAQLQRTGYERGPGVADQTLIVVVIYPDLLGTYGDGGNGLVLARRADMAGRGGEPGPGAVRPAAAPAGDLYCLGGGEDGPQVRAATTLIADGTLLRAAADGAVVLGVCAGFQLLGREFPDAADRPHDGLGLLDVTTRKGTDVRAVGELVAASTRPPLGAAMAPGSRG